ncbi:MAG: CynX/NimT family MFS transporter [Thermacetogeniaceae bacterium]|nr:MFS transporter [Thermoanaerobacterales bacterium]
MKRKSWAVLFAAYLAGVAVALNQFKVPPVMQVLMDSLQVDMATGGWLMSVFSVAGVIFALPAAFLLGRLGPKASGLIALGCTLFGSVLGALAQQVGVLLAGRVIEGIGLALIAVVAPAVISMWFEPQERGLPMGIWASWVPVATFVMYNIAGIIENSFGWQGVWWFGTVVSLIAFVAYAAVVGTPAGNAAGEKQTETPVSYKEGLMSTNTWLLAIAFAGFNFALVGYMTWAPTFFTQLPGIETAMANFYASLPNLVVVPGGIVAGWILDRTKNRKAVLATSLTAAAVILIWCFRLGSVSVVVPYMIGLGLIVSFIPSSTFTLAPETAPRPELAGMALGVVTIGQNIGMLMGPPLVASAAAVGNWAYGTYPVIAASVVAIAAALFMRMDRAGGQSR